MDRNSLLSIVSVMLIIIGLCIAIWTVFNIPIELSYTYDSIIINTSDIENVNLVPDVKEKLYITLYPKYPVKGENIGSLTIPALKRKISIYEGTENNELKKDAGHYIGSALPGEDNNTVISGHSQTVFRKLDTLKKGDLLIVETSAGKFTYEVSNTKVVDKEDRTVIIPIDHAVLTLTTCYPFNFVGYEPYRYIVSANLIKSE